MERANACAKLMINEAIDAEILAEVKDASGDIAEALGLLQTLLNNTGDSISDLKISVALTKYERIREMKGKIQSQNIGPCVRLSNLIFFKSDFFRCHRKTFYKC